MVVVVLFCETAHLGEAGLLEEVDSFRIDGVMLATVPTVQARFCQDFSNTK